MKGKNKKMILFIPTP